MPVTIDVADWARTKENIGENPKREISIRASRVALLDKLTLPGAWPKGAAPEVRRFYRYLDYFRRSQYNHQLIGLEQAYEIFSPDEAPARHLTAFERKELQKRVVEATVHLLQMANYQRIDPSAISLILVKDSHYGLDFNFETNEFEEIEIFYSGATSHRRKRTTGNVFARRQNIDVPVFRRLFVLFKFRTLEDAVESEMRSRGLSREAAETVVARRRRTLPDNFDESKIYIKLFKNIPRSDIEMVFPNSAAQLRFFDKLRVGFTAGTALGLGAIGTAGKLALIATNPIAFAGAVAGLGLVALRQSINLGNQKQRYMTLKANTLYFHSLADNISVIHQLGARAAEQDVKEEMLLYSVLAKEQARRTDLPEIDQAIEQFMLRTFDEHVNLDLEDALNRLIKAGLVTEKPDGSLVTLGPTEASSRIDAAFDSFLDSLPEDSAEHDGPSAIRRKSTDLKMPPSASNDDQDESEPASDEISRATGSGKHVFLSYASADRAIADGVVSHLEKFGTSCWIAPRDIPMGADYQEAIVDALENMSALVLVLSEASNASAHVKREVNIADEMRKPILPLRVGDSIAKGALRYQLNNRQYVDLGTDIAAAVETLRRQL